MSQPLLFTSQVLLYLQIFISLIYQVVVSLFFIILSFNQVQELVNVNKTSELKDFKSL
jgi:hypothetical protein